MRKLYILMNNELAGELLQDSSGCLSFIYSTEWMQKPYTRPISLSLPLLNKKFNGETVYNFFDNLLPDNPQIRNSIQRNFYTKSCHPFDLLAQIGKECAGDIQIIEKSTPNFPDKNIQSQVLNETEIANILRTYKLSPLGMIKDDNEFRISIAGAQEKMAFLWYQNQWHRPHKTTSTTHIFKLPIGYKAHQVTEPSKSCENEWLCLSIAKAFGLNVANSKLLQFEDIKVLAVERFDRKFCQDKNTIIRLPQEDLCQALGYSSKFKYQSNGGPGIKEVMDLLNGSQKPKQDRDAFFKAQIVNWCLGAIDAHAKNFSINIQAQGQYRLNPLYDMMSAYPLVENGELPYENLKMAMALYGNGAHYKLNDIQKLNFIETAKLTRYSTKQALNIFNEVMEQMDTVIENISDDLPSEFPSKIAECIFNGMKKFRNLMVKVNYK